MPTIDTAEDARAHAGAQVAVTGTAHDAKLGAAVVTTDGLVVYCHGIARWPAEVAGTRVIVHGTLEHTDQFVATTGPAGEISQGTSGPVWVLRDCRYETVR